LRTFEGDLPAQFRPGDGKEAHFGVWIDQHGISSWRRLHLCDMLQGDREREIVK